MSDLIAIGALWPGKKDGVLTGKMGEARLVVLPNDRRQNDSQPSHRVFVASAQDKQSNDSGNNPPF